jgi:hypothetical protein
MQTPRKEMRGTRVYAVPLFGIVVLLASYWLLADWQQVPATMRALLDVAHLPH